MEDLNKHIRKHVRQQKRLQKPTENIEVPEKGDDDLYHCQFCEKKSPTGTTSEDTLRKTTSAPDNLKINQVQLRFLNKATMVSFSVNIVKRQ